MSPGKTFSLLSIHVLFVVSAAATAQTTPIEDIGWPRQIVKNGATLIYYQPQVEDWKNYKDIKAEMAFSLTSKSGRQILGVASLEANTLTDKDARTVFIRDLKVNDVRFPSLGQDSVANMSALFKQLVPGNGETISLDRVIADMNRTKSQSNAVTLKTDPPQIFYSTSPAIILTVEGDSALLAPVGKLKLKYIVNTNWDVFFDQTGKDYYLLAKNVWLKSKSYKGPWTKTTSLPAELGKLPAGQNFDEVKKMIPAPANTTSPEVYFSNKPAELILLKGSPIYTKITGTNLLYAANTESDLFLDNKTKQYYVLFSGRWFRSSAFGGPWQFTSNELPADFSKIPENSAKAHVLASVPGTVQSSDAVLLAQVPTTAIVNKKDVEAKVKVVYSGDPQFKAIDSTQLQYAVNTQSKVVKDGAEYYLCDNAVWFRSANPNGPWKVADSIPKEIYSIPPSSPVYNITYVTQTNPTETTVESSYTSGYLGMFIFGTAFGACIAYGTGWYYPPYMWWGPGMYYPFYNPWPCAWGAGAVYNPWTGGWAAGRAYYGPYGYARSAAGYNPATGRYGHAATVQGWYNGRTAAGGYNPWTGNYAGTRQGHSPYAQWGTSVAGRGDQWVRTGHVTTGAGTAFGFNTSGGASGVVGPNGTKVVNGKNGTFAGHDGNIYRRDDNGDWSKYQNGNWQQRIGGDGGTRQQLNQSFQSRERGQIQTQRFQNFHRGSGGGGGFRGGRRR
ncbi:hypothetical protein GS399_09160 [Pedobacter sp. HMF7647]|uniref:Carbohydrate-binding family V/XII n=1 Tax=Hufsiella arboris TaxID=2695275 RepID=A0A7K1Y969_9SPHI|nr:hypothetical protein [Hufsiella arboris]MXV51136.1 hypothetical protein [Hufsiella arboris]